MASLKLAINKVGVKKDEIFQDAVKAKEEAEAKYEILLKKIDGWIWEIDRERNMYKMLFENHWNLRVLTQADNRKGDF